MFKSTSYRLLSLLVGSLILTACNTSSDPTALNKSAIDNARKTEGYVATKGAAIVARVTINGKICHQANIQLQAVENGQLVPRNITSIGQNYSLADIGKITLRMATLNIPGVFDVIDSQDIRVSFQPIAPGDYGIARVICSWDSNHRSVLEASSSGFFGLGRKKALVPLAIDGTISVKKGRSWMRESSTSFPRVRGALSFWHLRHRKHIATPSSVICQNSIQKLHSVSSAVNL
ncbi:hypothetical protein HED52_03690 [Ochrobactrum ciceri]|uniref:Lipoprotein n=2 Tax=Brucella TaxID=234 RepID=A0ABX1DW32_9HYPH|nr:hypothetical protein [Brucella ciceri]